MYEHAYEGLDRDVGLQIAEESNKSRLSVPGIGWFTASCVVGVVGPHRSGETEEGDVFVDLGSGLGKMVLSARWPAVQSAGVSRSFELHGKATAALGGLRDAVGESFAMLPPMRLECGDMLAADVADADIVYCFATCFSPEIVGAMEAKLAAEMKPGARLVLVSKQMETDAFEPFGPNGGYVSVEQAHSEWNLDCYIYGKAASADRER